MGLLFKSEQKPRFWQITLLSTKGENNFSTKVHLSWNIQKWDVSSRQRNWPNGTYQLSQNGQWSPWGRLPIYSLDIFFSIVFRKIFLTGQFSYYKVYLKKLGAPKKHLTLLCWPAHSPGQCHGDQTVSSHHSKLTSDTYIQPHLFISQRYCTDLARHSATPFPDHDNNYVLFCFVF